MLFILTHPQWIVLDKPHRNPHHKVQFRCVVGLMIWLGLSNNAISSAIVYQRLSPSFHLYYYDSYRLNTAKGKEYDHICNTSKPLEIRRLFIASNIIHSRNMHKQLRLSQSFLLSGWIRNEWMSECKWNC